MAIARSGFITSRLSIPRSVIGELQFMADNADGDNNPFTGTDADLIWVRAAITDPPVEMITLVTR